MSIASNAAEDQHLEWVRVNGDPGFAVHQGDRLHSVWALHIIGQTIRAVYCIRNPEKLRHLGVPLLEGDAPTDKATNAPRMT